MSSQESFDNKLSDRVFIDKTIHASVETDSTFQIGFLLSHALGIGPRHRPSKPSRLLYIPVA